MKTRLPGGVIFRRFSLGESDRPGTAPCRPMNTRGLAKRVCLGALIFSVFTLGGPVFASGDDNGPRVDVDVTTGGDSVNVTGGDTTLNAGDLVGGTSTNSNKSFGFAHALGDVDINEGQNCLGSEQWGTFIVSRQTNELNPWCAALFYELNGKHEFAAKMRCDIKEIGSKYDDPETCVLDQTLGQPPAVPPELAGLYNQAAIFDEHQDREETHELAIAETIRRQDELEAQIKREAANRRAYSRKQAEASKLKADDEYEFQQQTLEQWAQIVEPPTPEDRE